MSVLFVMPPGGASSSFTEHLGVGFLRAVLARAGVPAAQYLPARNPSLPAFARALEARRPRVIGLTVYESNLRAARALARVARRILPEAVVLVGGPNATFSPEETLALLGADACLRGAGEGTIADIARAILGAERPRQRLPALLAGVPNLVLAGPGGPVRTRTGDLSSFPSEHFGHLDDLPSPYQADLFEGGDVGLLTSRGCNQHCTYCSFAAISGRKVHFHGVERVLDDLAAFRAHLARLDRPPEGVSVLDDAFTLSPQRAAAICEGILRRGLTLPLHCETRADRVDPALLRLMRRAGFVGVSFGLESASPRVLRAAGKVQDPAAADDPGLERERAWLENFRGAVEAARAAGLTPNLSIIGGLPGEGPEDLRATLDFVASLGVPAYAHNLLTAMPGTPLHAGLGGTGLRAWRDEDTGEWTTAHAYDVRAVSALPHSQLRGLRLREAGLIADALCGRPRQDLAGDGGAWAVVIDGDAPADEAAAWLPEVLAVNGLVLVVEGERPLPAGAWRAWARRLRQAAVPHGTLALLAKDPAAPGGRTLTTAGTLGVHRFERAERAGGGGRRLVVGPEGDCQVPLWVASAPGTAPPWATGGPAPQVADGCRWWSGWRRCHEPQVLRVAADGAVRPCWYGPALGRIGDAWDALMRAAAALGTGEAADQRCPLGGAQPIPPEVAQAAEFGELAAALAWRATGAVDGSERSTRRRVDT